MKIAAIQMVSSPDVKQNMARAFSLMQQARQDGAELLVLPEYWPLMGMHDSDKLAVAEQFAAEITQDSAQLQKFLAESACTLDAWIIGGTIPLQSEIDGKVMNSCLVYNRQGELKARYDKIHLFGFKKGQESYDESQTIVAGTDVVTFESEFGKVGLSICYDLRFPELFRAMGECNLLVLPAAFTYTTGQAHWEILLRARAIENQCYVLASAQGGLHENGRRTWGHSMLIDPWGNIVSELDSAEGFVSGIVDLANLANIRTNLPALRHKQLS